MRTTRSSITSTARTTSTRRRRVAGLAATLVAGVALTGGALGASPASANQIGGVKSACAPAKIHVAAGQKVVHGTCGDDLIFVGHNNNVTVYAGGGNDDIRGGWGDGHVVTVIGGAGNDEISVNPGKRLIADGGTGNDIIVGGDLDDILFGGDGNDELTGENGANVLSGGNGNDFLDSREWGNGPLKPDHLVGGTGWDLANWMVGDNRGADIEGGNSH